MITSSVGKREPGWFSFMSTEKRKKEQEAKKKKKPEYTCDPKAIEAFVGLYEACMDGLIGFIGNLVCTFTSIIHFFSVRLD